MPGSTIECPSCALEVDDDAETCPYCGYEFPRQKAGLKFIALLIVALMLWPLFKLLQALFG
jgi:hypothetical protein